MAINGSMKKGAKMLTHYEGRFEGHAYYSPVDDPDHLDPGDVDQFGRCMHGLVSCMICEVDIAGEAI
jgi:hypothetical protein